MQVKRYSTGAIIIHWLTAILVIANWLIVEYAEGLPEAAERAAMGNHFAIGMLILALTVLRIIWRLTHKPPPLPTDIKTWEATLAKVVWFLFYLLLIVMPLAGWAASSMYGQGINMFGLFTIPPLPVAENADQGHEIFEAHGAAGVFLLLLIALHVAGALKHQFFDKDDDMARMWFGKNDKQN